MTVTPFTFAGPALLGFPARIAASEHPSSLIAALALIAALFFVLVLFLALSTIAAILFAPLDAADDERFAYRPVSSLPRASNPERVSTEPDPIESYPITPALALPVTAWVEAHGMWPVPLNPITNRPVRDLE